MKNILFVIFLGIILIGCKKDAPISLDYFYNFERSTILLEDFNSNSNNWTLVVDSTERDNETYVDSFTSNSLEPSSSQIQNGELYLFANNGDNSKATLNTSNLELNKLQYICIELHFKKYITNSMYYLSRGHGHPNYFTFSIGQYLINENLNKDQKISLEGKVNILYVPSTNKVFTAVENDKAIENLYFSVIDNNIEKDEIYFSAACYSVDMAGRWLGKTIIDKIEIYTINPEL